MMAALAAPPATKTGAGPTRSAASPASAKPTGTSAAEPSASMLATRASRSRGTNSAACSSRPSPASESAPHWPFNQPLRALFGLCFAAGFALDGLEELAFGPEDAGASPLSWLNFPDIPPVLVARLGRPL